MRGYNSRLKKYRENIIEDVISGLSPKEVAEKYEASIFTILRILDRNGVKKIWARVIDRAN